MPAPHPRPRVTPPRLLLRHAISTHAAWNEAWGHQPTIHTGVTGAEGQSVRGHHRGRRHNIQIRHENLPSLISIRAMRAIDDTIEDSAPEKTKSATALLTRAGLNLGVVSVAVAADAHDAGLGRCCLIGKAATPTRARMTND